MTPHVKKHSKEPGPKRRFRFTLPELSIHPRVHLCEGDGRAYLAKLRPPDGQAGFPGWWWSGSVVGPLRIDNAVRFLTSACLGCADMGAEVTVYRPAVGMGAVTDDWRMGRSRVERPADSPSAMNALCHTIAIEASMWRVGDDLQRQKAALIGRPSWIRRGAASHRVLAYSLKVAAGNWLAVPGERPAPIWWPARIHADRCCG